MMRVPAVLSACVLALACLMCPAGSAAQGRKELRVGVVGIPTALDPAIALEGATPLISRQIFDTLVAYREGSTDVEPALATRWAVGRDGLVWTFTLRDGVRFHDGSLLTASEVAQLKLDAEWVVLSACNTIAGDKPGAEALSGLARAFFYAGARALLVSHWAVDSNATVKLITAAVREIARDNVGRAEALRRSMLALIDSDDLHMGHPAYWAPFIVVGEGGH